ncbi:MAG: DUF4124 domain-containing protein [Marinobacter sp.]|uniref:DUF4124 domain-containing protein n=1 Tax=Marinobacter sp. TaxID=50741 RepID=UPI00299DB303|nr:DUF4124 domain-containing protein [Marinobacter sp.]MDX1757283.1 DUF4124 domain-containing protein [Marinobacter sp.]
MAVIVALAPATGFGESVYKWTDEEGVTHFGDRQPTGTRAESVNIRTGGSTGPTSGPTPQERMGALEERQRSEEEQERLSAVEEARQKQRQANCETARSNLAILNSYGRVQVEENGEKRYLTPEEIAEQKASFQQIADDNCGPAANQP